MAGTMTEVHGHYTCGHPIPRIPGVEPSAEGIEALTQVVCTDCFRAERARVAEFAQRARERKMRTNGTGQAGASPSSRPRPQAQPPQRTGVGVSHEPPVAAVPDPEPPPHDPFHEEDSQYPLEPVGEAPLATGTQTYARISDVLPEPKYYNAETMGGTDFVLVFWEHKQGEFGAYVLLHGFFPDMPEDAIAVSCGGVAVISKLARLQAQLDAQKATLPLLVCLEGRMNDKQQKYWDLV